MKHLFFVLFIALSTTTLLGQGTTVYGLNFTTGELRFAAMDIQSGNVQVLSTAPLSADLFQQGVADFDPYEKVYYYIRGSGNQAQIISVDALTGTVISAPYLSNTNNAVMPITNIAYNWLDETIYGMNHFYNGMDEELRLVSVDPNTGAITFISSAPVSTVPYLSGNSDIDPVHRRYFYATGDRIFTVDLDDGTAIYDMPIIFPGGANGQFLANLTYNWNDNFIYCLYMSTSISNPGQASLKLAKVDPATGIMTVLSSNSLSSDGFSMGDCDIDPAGNRFFYIRQNILYTAELSTGNLLSTTPIQNTNNAITPIINMSYDEFAVLPLPIAPMDMGEEVILEPGENFLMDVSVGGDAQYLWSTGSTMPKINITEVGTYSVTITQGDLSIIGSIDVSENVATVINRLSDEFSIQTFPNPSKDYLEYSCSEILDRLSIVNSLGREVLLLESPRSNIQIKVSDFPRGVYFLIGEKDGKISSQKIILE